MPYQHIGIDTISDGEMQQMIADYRHDGATVDYLHRPHACGYRVCLPGEADRFSDGVG